MPAVHALAAETAASHLVVDVPSVAPTDAAGAILAAMVAHTTPCADLLCVVDAHKHLLGTIDLAVLVAAPPTALAGDLMDTDVVSARVDEDQEVVAHRALRKEVTSVPVVDAQQRLVGVIPALALTRILYREHEEDVHKLAGVARESALATDALEAPARRRARDRLPWLLVGLLGSGVATWVTSRFEATLSARVTISFFIPAVVYLADAVGTQTEAIVVRGLAHEEHRFNAWRLLFGEIRTGLLIGGVLAAVVLPAVWLAFGDVRLALAVALSLFVAAAIATAIGMGLPWILHQRGIDPAYGSGPLATVLQDVLSLVVYLLVVTALLPP